MACFGLADAVGAAGDDRDLAFEAHGLPLVPQAAFEGNRVLSRQPSIRGAQRIPCSLTPCRGSQAPTTSGEPGSARAGSGQSPWPSPGSRRFLDGSCPGSTGRAFGTNSARMAPVCGSSVAASKSATPSTRPPLRMNSLSACAWRLPRASHDWRWCCRAPRSG